MKAMRAFLVIVGLVVGAGVVSVIPARAKYGEILHTRAQFEQLKPGAAKAVMHGTAFHIQSL